MKKMFPAVLFIAVFPLGARSQRLPAQTVTAMTKALNPAASPAAAAGNALAAGALAHTGVVSIAHSLPVCMTQGGCPGITMSYGVPGLVFLDRWNLVDTLFGRINELQNDYTTWAQEDPNAPILAYIDGEIARVQGFLDNLKYSCQPVDFKGYHATVNADVIYHDPVTGAVQLMQAGPDGNIPLNLIPFGALNGDPVKATMMIYKY